MPTPILKAIATVCSIINQRIKVNVMVNKLNANDFEKEVLGFEGTVLLDFYADWCGPCKMLSPTVDAVSEEYPDVKFFKVNVDEFPELAVKFGIVSIPTLVVFKNGKLTSQNVGYCMKEAIVRMIEA